MHSYEFLILHSGDSNHKIQLVAKNDKQAINLLIGMLPDNIDIWSIEVTRDDDYLTVKKDE